MRMKAAVLWDDSGKFQINEVELAEPKSNEVLVKIAGTGVCHTDTTVIDRSVPIPLPAIVGHEGSGVVEAVGSEVKGVKPGDKVVLTYYTCGHCPACIAGMPSGCESYGPVNFGGHHGDWTHRLSTVDGKEISTFFAQSSFAEYAVVDQRACIVIDDADVDVALLGPLGCGIMTGAGAVCNTLAPRVGDSIAIFGCGGVGLSAVMMAKAMGCTTIIGVDAVPSRLELAKELGCTHVINGKETPDIAEAIKEITKGGAGYSLDTTAVPALMKAALNCLKIYGTCAVVGTSGDKELSIVMQYELMGVGKTLKGCIEGDADPHVFIPRLVELYKAGLFPFDKLIKEYPLEQINEAFEDSHNGKTIKPIVRMN